MTSTSVAWAAVHAAAARLDRHAEKRMVRLLQSGRCEASPAELGRWDVIVRRFPNHRLPHTRAWIDALGASGCGKPLYLLLEDDAGIAGRPV